MIWKQENGYIEPTLSSVAVPLDKMWNALEWSKPRRLLGVNILMFKLYKDFCSDDFAETRRVKIRRYYELIAEV